MKLCIPTETNEGPKAKVFGHFGSAPYFTIFDSEKDTFEIIDNFNQHHAHGTCHPMGLLGDKNIDVVVCGGMGVRAVQKLNESGIRAYKMIVGTTEEIIKKYKEGNLEEITIKNSCNQHHCR